MAKSPEGGLRTHKLLSENPEVYRDAAVHGIREILNLDANAPVPTGLIEAVKMGTTVATNALLERKGEKTVLFITKGMKDLLRIGYQNRPKLFGLIIELPELPYDDVFEVEERLDAEGNVVIALDTVAAREALSRVFGKGHRSVAFALMHSYRFPDHEQRHGAANWFHVVNRDHKLSLRKQCELLHLSRSRLYYQPVGESAENLRFMAIIDKQFLETP